MDQKLNILFLASWYPSRINPFNGNFVQRHAKAVSEFCNVTVLHACSDPGLAQKYEIVSRENDGIHEVLVYYRKVRHNIPLVSPLKKYIRSNKALKKGFKEVQSIQKTELVHLNVTFPAGLFALHLKKRHDLQYVITEHWTIFLDSDPGAFPGFTKNLVKKILKGASMICPVSHDLEKAIKRYAPDKQYMVVNNVVNTQLFGIREPGNKKKRIVHVSTLNEDQKNISGILRSVKALSPKRNDFEILIVGDGDTEPHIMYARSIGLSEDIFEFRGKQPIEKIAEIMQGSDIFLLFSNYENLPCVIIEAHASGLPVISTDVGGISEMINEENGVLIPKADETALVSELDKMLDRLGKYDRKSIRDEAVAKYSYSVIGKQFYDIYKELIQ
ncbi:MAG: glycosyltransferase [Bacteroidales bacterium]|jgi:glycosyltransferase involved in cell wall biosynthesis|nr:glycosyltransferase [Bacteroidales bacterium]